MATVAPSAEKTADLLQNLSLEPQAKSLEIPEPNKKTSVYQYGAVDSGVATDGQIQEADRSVTPILTDLMDPTLCYVPNGYASHAYYYGGFNGTGNEWDEFARYGNTDGVDMTTGVYGDSGALMFHNGYGYAPFGPYSPAATPVPQLGNDGQLYGSQQYQYPPYFQPQNQTSAPIAANQTPSFQTDLSSNATTEQKPLASETAKGNSNSFGNSGVKGSNGTPFKPAYQNSTVNNTYGRGHLPGGFPASGYQDPRFGYDGEYRGNGYNSSYSKVNNVQSKNNQYRQNSNYMGLHQAAPMSGMGSPHGFINRMYPNKYYGQYGGSFRSNMGFGSAGYDSRINGGWLSADGKNKLRGRGNGYLGYRNDTIDGLNELNRGPRAKVYKNQKGFVPVTLMVKGQSLPINDTISEEKEDTAVAPNREDYNKTDFTENYNDAKIFIIKSYSEDDVHKSIKYNVWASTPNGNKKLDAAYQEAQQKSDGCPIFLFFSVNTSGQFVGMAEMVGAVDFDKNVEYWQQDKWTGCFPVKWHIVKDIPNSLLKHIILENNDNKPVTNSRDTQEVKLESGLKMIKIFKEHTSKTCILDDFSFYEKRQKVIQEKKVKHQIIQKQVAEIKPVTEKKDMPNESTKLPETLSEPSVNNVQANGEVHPQENGSITITEDAPKVAKSVSSEKRVVSNGIANGC